MAILDKSQFSRDRHVVSSGAWVRTASEALTAAAAAAGAAVGGVWTYFRYRRQDPDVPRVNASVTATLFDDSGVDYLAIETELQHLAGGILKIVHDEEFDPPAPLVEVGRLVADQTDTLSSTPVTSVEVLADQTELGSGESAKDSKVVRLGTRPNGTIAYEVTLRLVAGWASETWTWCANAVVRATGPETATGATVVGPRHS